MGTLNIATKLFPEGEKGGLLICGVNWGGDPSEPSTAENPSFFSDKRVNDYRYRNRLVKWFALLGHPLEEKDGMETSFERSIVQTNWLYGQAKDMRDKDIVAECIAHPDCFLYHIETLRPSLVMLVGLGLFKALNASTCRERAERSLGPASEPVVLRKTEFARVNGLIAFGVGTLRFERCMVVAVPHPTGTIGLTDQYIEAFKPELGPLLTDFKNGLTTRRADARG